VVNSGHRVATRVILGFHLSLDAPSSTSVALALSQAVLPKRLSLESEAISGSSPLNVGSRKRTAVLDEDAGLARPRGPERILPENCNMEPARSCRTGILQVKEFSTGNGIKPPIEARFLQVKEKRHQAIGQGHRDALRV
jgi:hypothetical protein